MFIRNTALLALGASAVIASPLNKRQASSVVSSVAGSASSAASSAVGSVTGSATSAAESVTGSAAATGSEASTSTAVSPSSGAESATSALGSAVSSAATGTSSAPLPTATTEGNATSAESYAFGCPDGYSISYVVGTAPYAGVDIEQAYSALENWGTAIPPPIEALNSTGEGEGAERSWALSLGEVNLTVSEVLTRVNETPSTFLEQEWNLTMPITVSPSLIISNYTNVLTLYSNSTSNDTTVQLFSNFCASDQPAGIELYSQLVTAYLSGLQTLFTNGTASDNSTTAATSSTSMMSSSMASSMVSSSAASGTSSVASAASSGASGVVGTASSAVAGAISTATGAPASVATSLVGGLTSAL